MFRISSNPDLSIISMATSCPSLYLIYWIVFKIKLPSIAISKIDEYWDYAHGDYLAELNNYANAVDESYTNRPAYISVKNYAKETII